MSKRVSVPQAATDWMKAPEMSSVSETCSIDELCLDTGQARMETLREEARNTQLPEDIREVFGLYEQRIGDRNWFLYRWLHYVFEEIELSCVASEHSETVREIKTIMTIYDTLLDDLSEKHNDMETFWELAKFVIPGSEPTVYKDGLNEDYMVVGEAVWEAIESKLKTAPRYDEFKQQFHFDMRQAVNAMDYSRVAMEYEGASNATEMWHHAPHNMMMYGFVDADLMFSPEFDRSDMESLREIVHELQRMWRIGNWVITWERELEEHDYSAGVIIGARKAGVVTDEMLEQLENGEVSTDRVEELVRETRMEEVFLADWQNRRDTARRRADEVGSIDVDEYVDALEFLMENHLASRGHR